MILIIIRMNCVCTRICNGSVVVFLVLYVDNILLIGNDVCVLSSVKFWLSNQFDMKDLGEASYILRIKVIRDRKNRMLGLSQATYIGTVLTRFSMQDFKKMLLTFQTWNHSIQGSVSQAHEEIESMKTVPYVIDVEST